MTASATWFPDSGEHYFSSAGHLVTGEVTSASDESITVCAFYNWQFGVKDVTVNNLATLNSVTISGPDEVDENSSADYTAAAHWDDGSGDVTDSGSWSPDGKWISYDSYYFAKARSEGIIWQVEIDEFLKRALAETR